MTSRASGPGRPPGLTGDDLLVTARDVFLEHGYAGTSMEEVARRARISKASLYRDHSSKTELYAAVVRQWAAAGRDAMRPALQRLAADTDARRGLTELAETMRAAILSEPVLRMRRLVIAEAAAHPEVARLYLEDSWNRNIGNLADTLAQMPADRGLEIDDAHAAASEFTWLVIGPALNAQLLGAEETGGPVRRAVDAFLARYGRPAEG
ncbi:TetR/AcrR family transcriptional regulator [Microbacterium paraoxydans]|uniref:TetR/AcrR family transcriptional regulator n=1 Tax=Microbacterium paraoxydans TaxID=199592 RepID=UPI003D75694F